MLITNIRSKKNKNIAYQEEVLVFNCWSSKPHQYLLWMAAANAAVVNQFSCWSSGFCQKYHLKVTQRSVLCAGKVWLLLDIQDKIIVFVLPGKVKGNPCYTKFPHLWDITVSVSDLEHERPCISGSNDALKATCLIIFCC